MLRPQLLHRSKDAPPFFPPAPLERWFPRKGRSSSWRGGHRRHGNAALLGPTDSARPGAAGRRVAWGQHQQHGQPVRGGGGRLPGQGVSQQKGNGWTLRSPGGRSSVGKGAAWVSLGIFAPSWVGERSTPSVRLRLP